jgi:hypothetical protein
MPGRNRGEVPVSADRAVMSQRRESPLLRAWLWLYGAQMLVVIPFSALLGLMAGFAVLVSAVGAFFEATRATPSAPWWGVLPTLLIGLWGLAGLLGWWVLSWRFLSQGRAGLRTARCVWWVLLGLGMVMALFFHGFLLIPSAWGKLTGRMLLEWLPLGLAQLLMALQLLLLRRYGPVRGLPGAAAGSAAGEV